MKNISECKIETLGGTFNIIEKQFVTPRYLQLVLKGESANALENLKVGSKVKLQPASETNEKENHSVEGKHGRSFLITKMDAEQSTLTVEAITAFEQDAYFTKLTDGSVDTIRLKSKMQHHGFALQEEHAHHKHHHNHFSLETTGGNCCHGKHHSHHDHHSCHHSQKQK